MQLLLDTSTVLFAALEEHKIPQAGRQVILASSSEIYISAVSVWEVCQKITVGKLKAISNVREFFAIVCEKLDAQLIPFDANSSYHLSSLPPIHKDPFDRMLICQAIERGLAIVTGDTMIAKYPIKVIW